VSAAPAHLAVMRYLQTEFDARAIRAALDFGWIDRPERAGEIAEPGRGLLLGLLAANGVFARDRLALTPEFRETLRFRDLLEARIAFADLVWPDIHKLFAPLLADLPQFMARSRTFDLFRYDRAQKLNAENRRATEAWTRFTTVLTRYEAPAALDAVDLDGVETFLDLGGNTGEFAQHVCRRAGASALVVDLPVVCAIGRDHVAESGARVAFHAADFRRDPLPGPADLVSFKSVLHDWPDADARALLARAREAVRPGGRLMIFERAPLVFSGRPAYGLAPDLAFLHFLRPARLYLDTLRELGFVDIELRIIALEVDFHLILARRP
jgi:SAM-dependent methyltransferase